ncbi:MAG: DNA/RNA non-specific endonuclease [Halomonas sp.]
MSRRSPLRRRGRPLRRLAVTLLFVSVAAGLWHFQERELRDSLVWMGVPEWQQPSVLAFHRVLRNEGFLLGWSDIRVNPLWVGYRVTPVSDSRIGSRPDFQADWRTLWPVGTGHYAGSGYDRGHLAPNYAIAAVHGRDAQRDTFYMSNMSPQRPDLNRRLWQRLEEAVMDHFAPRFGELQVITGPVFPERFRDNVFNRVGFVEVPEAFYKILVVPGERPRALAFLMPQEVRGNEPLDDFLVSIDEIEARTGLDFFPRLPEDDAETLEAGVNPRGWALSEVATRPGRYE